MGYSQGEKLSSGVFLDELGNYPEVFLDLNAYTASIEPLVQVLLPARAW